MVLKNCGPEHSYISPEHFDMCLNESCYPNCWKVLLVVLILKNVGKRSTAKNCHPVSLLSVVSKVFEKRVNNKVVDHLEKYGLLDQLQILWQLYLMELLELLTDLGLLELQQLIYPRPLTGFAMLVFFTCWS